MMIPFIAAGIAMVVWSAHSDSTRERRWHAALPLLIGGAGLVGAGLVSSPVAAFLFLIIATAGIYCAFGPFWTLPAVFLAGTGAATGIAVINSVGNAGGFIGPTLVGLLTQSTGSTNAGLIAIGGCLLIGGVLAAVTHAEMQDIP
jgi:ACS family tartrate transporter-like MFS transporter